MNNCQRILVVIVHYFDQHGDRSLGSLRDTPTVRAEALGRTITSLHDLFNDHTISLDYRSTYVPRPANTDLCYTLDIVILTTHGMTVFEHLAIDSSLFEEIPTDAEPIMLGFEANRIFQERAHDYDRFVYLEDDIILHDPFFFAKLDWFEALVGSQALLQPHLYEVTERDGRGKVYIDGDFVPDQITRYRRISGQSAKVIEAEQLGQQLRFCYAPNPHSGCYFLSQAQLHLWLEKPWYLDRDTRLVRSFESAASLGILKTFDIYKPDLNCAAFLEVQHFGEVNLAEVIPQTAAHVLNDKDQHGQIKPKELRLAELEAEVEQLELQLQAYQKTSLLQKNAQLAGEIQHLDTLIREQKIYTEQLEEIIQQQIQSATSTQTQQEIKIHRLEEKLKHSDTVIQRKTTYNKQLEAIIHQQLKLTTSKQAQQEQEIHRLENTLIQMQNSKSWRLTTPLRSLRRQLKR